MIKHEHRDCSALLRKITLHAPGGLTTVKVMSNGELDAYHDCHISPGDEPAKMDIRDDDGNITLRCNECGVAMTCDLLTRDMISRSIEALLNTVEVHLAAAEITSSPSDTA